MTNDDYISREAAYKTLTEYYHHSSGVQHTVLREALNRVPTAAVRPVVRAFWVGEMNGVGICSNCKRLDHLDPLATHCRYCGAEIASAQLRSGYEEG